MKARTPAVATANVAELNVTIMALALIEVDKNIATATPCVLSSQVDKAPAIRCAVTPHMYAQMVAMTYLEMKEADAGFDEALGNVERGRP